MCGVEGSRDGCGVGCRAFGALVRTIADFSATEMGSLLLFGQGRGEFGLRDGFSATVWGSSRAYRV